MAARTALVGSLQPHVALAYERVSAGHGDARLAYRSSLDDDATSLGRYTGEAGGSQAAGGNSGRDVAVLEARLLEAMARLRSREIERGVCLVGPHRDDLSLGIGDLPARGYASHGESWSLALALRLASYELLRADESGEWSAGGEPVLILDDVFAELDTRRRDRLAAMVSSAEQVVVTAAAAADVPEVLEGARFDVGEGKVTRVR